ncbi:MAG: VCBS repeat-containing protein [Cyclobacteriaceae bacterium]
MIVVGEWMSVKILKNDRGVFSDISESTTLSNDIGWWNCMVAEDFDGDGDLDLVAGNLGLNYKYKASKEEPFEIFASDFDQTGSLDIVLGYHNAGQLYPVRGRQCSSEHMPFIKKKFPSYEAFGNASIYEIYGEDNLAQSIHYKATNFSNSYFENLGEGKYKIKPLPIEAQLSSVNSIEIMDINSDGYDDLILMGNLLNSEVETPRNDASYGLCLLGDGTGEFRPMNISKSGLMVEGEVRSSAQIETNHGDLLIVARNNEKLKLFQINPHYSFK